MWVDAGEYSYTGINPESWNDFCKIVKRGEEERQLRKLREYNSR